LPRSLVARWIAWIQIWDFEIKHVLGKKNSATNGLSRQYCNITNIPLKPVEDVDDWVDTQLGAYYLTSDYPRERMTDHLSFVRINSSTILLDSSDSESSSQSSSYSVPYSPENLTSGDEIEDTLLDGKYSSEHQEAATYLNTLKVPNRLKKKHEIRKFISRTLRTFLVIKR